MSTTKVQGVPLIAQPTDGSCWYASAQMLYKYAAANGGVMKDPEKVPMTKSMFDRNSTWDSTNSGLLARTLGMSTHSTFPLDNDVLWYYLTVYGPIWTSLQKNWGGHNHGHVVVITGSRDGASGGVLIHDPEPMKRGSSIWLTWKQIKKAVDGQPEADYHFLTAQ